ncbi:MAG: hypothetical protein Q8M16_21670 [Pirellulaceae bacterium]|nr:hypothetical protein [Pirellulaceae bacterium]
MSSRVDHFHDGQCREFQKVDFVVRDVSLLASMFLSMDVSWWVTSIGTLGSSVLGMEFSIVSCPVVR